mmetsp:Transcript_26737/g.61529  ORF Transcript_26737/g.61529 Transcript_26737/m.61529 type:complete len:261 (-) Transcript_26737:520-1302(-)
MTIDVHDKNEQNALPPSGPLPDDTDPPSVTRRLDAKEIENLIESADRPGVKAQLTLLVQKLKREASALSRVEASKAKIQKEKSPSSVADENGDPVKYRSDSETRKVADTAGTVLPPFASAAMASSTVYTPIEKFAFDLGEYNSKFLTLHVPLAGVGAWKKSDPDAVTCNFTDQSFDLVARGPDLSNYRLFKDNLEKNIVAEKCKIIVKAEKIIIKLAKVKGEYSYDSWTQLTAKKNTQIRFGGQEERSAGIHYGSHEEYV